MDKRCKNSAYLTILARRNSGRRRMTASCLGPAIYLTLNKGRKISLYLTTLAPKSSCMRKMTAGNLDLSVYLTQFRCANTKADLSTLAFRDLGNRRTLAMRPGWQEYLLRNGSEWGLLLPRHAGSQQANQQEKVTELSGLHISSYTERK